MALAKYTFLPWLRQGLAARLAEADDLSSTASTERAQLAIELKIATEAVETGAAGEAAVQKNVQLAGPGDVVGFARRAIVRVEPNFGVHDFEPNLLAHVEFYEEDLPWRHTPAAEQVANPRRLRPWLALIVLKSDEFELKANPNGLAHLAIKQEKIGDIFHSENEHWAFAHVQISKNIAERNGDGLRSAVGSALGARPDSGISRLICPRKLAKNTPYTACLIPAFETGRLAGLGLPTAGVPSQKPSWAKAGIAERPRQFDWPVYFHWSFSTGELGDFETLVERLKPFQVPPDMGTLPFDVAQPGAGLDHLEKETNLMGFEAALRPPDFVREAFPSGEGDSFFQEKLAEYLNLNADLNGLGPVGRDILTAPNPFFDSSNLGDDPVIVPPTYGQFHALVRRLGEAGAPEWLETLNRDPRWRGVGGLGAESVRREQENLMQQAWQQIGRINEANRRIRQARAVQLMAKRAFSKHFKAADHSELLAMTGAAHGLMLGAAAARVALETQILESRLPVEAQSAAFRRAARPDFSLVRKMDARAVAAFGSFSAQKVNADLAQNFNLETSASKFLSASAPRSAPPNAYGIEAAATAISAAVLKLENDSDARAREVFFDAMGQMTATSLNKNEVRAAIDATAQPAEVKAKAKAMVADLTGFQKVADTGELLFTMKKTAFDSAFGDQAGRRTSGPVVLRKQGEGPTAAAALPIVSVGAVLEVQNDFALFAQKMDEIAQPRPFLEPLADLGAVRAKADLQLRPDNGLRKKVLAGIQFHRPGAPPRLADLVPIMAHPEYPQAAYDFLKQLSQDFILPNVERLPENSVSLMVTNRLFIEAYMAGLNHEMGRELLWREFPTDQRGSYFLTFWNPKDDPTTPEIEQRPDVKKLHSWAKKLGQHSAQPLSGGDPNDPNEGNLVLVVRGDLLKKYPNTMVFAQRGRYNPADPNGPRLLADETVAANVKWPIFSGELSPDIYLFGFDLTVDEAKGQRAAATGQPGWFFCFKERPGQTKFGLDDFGGGAGEGMPAPNRSLTTWDDLTWEDLVDDRDELAAFHVNFSKSKALSNPHASDDPVARWGDNAADLAAILLQDPVFYARHAAEMLF